MQRSLAQLEDELVERGIHPSTVPALHNGKKITSQDFIRTLQTYELEKRGGWNALSWGMWQRLGIESPMLCFSYTKLKEEEKAACMSEDRWYAEKKLDGVRMIVTYCPEEGFGFFSRNLSVSDFLPVEYTDKILLSYRGRLLTADCFVQCFPYSFVLDAEILCDEANIDTIIYLGKGGTRTETKLNAVSTILSIESKYSRQIQREQSPLHPVVFDVLRLAERNLVLSPLAERLKIRDQLIHELLLSDLSIEKVEGTIEGKEKFYADILAEGGEGIVLKNLDSPYIATSSRSRQGFVKRKRSLVETLGRDIDAFISGFVPSKPDKKWGHLIGALEMSVVLQYPDGTDREQTIAAVSGIPQEMREKMTVVMDGKPTLNSDYFWKVLTIDGQDFSPKSKRIMHAVADWNRGFRKDKTYFECTLDAEWLETQIL